MHICYSVNSETCQLVSIATESRGPSDKVSLSHLILLAGCDPDPFAHQYIAVQPARGPEISPLSPDIRPQTTGMAWHGNASISASQPGN